MYICISYCVVSETVDVVYTCILHVHNDKLCVRCLLQCNRRSSSFTMKWAQVCMSYSNTSTVVYTYWNTAVDVCIQVLPFSMWRYVLILFWSECVADIWVMLGEVEQLILLVSHIQLRQTLYGCVFNDCSVMDGIVHAIIIIIKCFSIPLISAW